MTSVHTLVSSEDVEGTEVFSRKSQDEIGRIHHLVFDKVSGRVAYADMSFGGFLGIGEGHYPVPWSALHYDTSLDGFVTDITKEQLESAPSYEGGSWEDRRWETRVHDYYGAPVYWGAAPATDTSFAVESTRALGRGRR